MRDVNKKGKREREKKESHPSSPLLFAKKRVEGRRGSLERFNERMRKSRDEWKKNWKISGKSSSGGKRKLILLGSSRSRVCSSVSATGLTIS